MNGKCIGKHTIDGCYGLEFKGIFVETQIGVETKNFLPPKDIKVFW